MSGTRTSVLSMHPGRTPPADDRFPLLLGDVAFVLLAAVTAALRIASA